MRGALAGAAVLLFQVARWRAPIFYLDVVSETLLR